jgi:hypothetical protein
MKAKGWVQISPAHIAKSAIVLLGCAFCVNSLAANNMPDGCNEISVEPQEFDIPVKTLIANKTEHVLVPASNVSDKAEDLSEIDPQSIAPIHSLTPRVLNILEQVFATDAATTESTDTESTEPASTVAGSDDGQDDEEARTEAVPLLQPQIQSQMYRKDI